MIFFQFFSIPILYFWSNPGTWYRSLILPSQIVCIPAHWKCHKNFSGLKNHKIGRNGPFCWYIFTIYSQWYAKLVQYHAWHLPVVPAWNNVVRKNRRRVLVEQERGDSDSTENTPRDVGASALPFLRSENGRKTLSVIFWERRKAAWDVAKKKKKKREEDDKRVKRGVSGVAWLATFTGNGRHSIDSNFFGFPLQATYACV